MSIDENDGLGGSYLQDPKTGKRTLIERTEDLVLAAPEATLAPAQPEAEQAISAPEAEQVVTGQTISDPEE